MGGRVNRLQELLGEAKRIAKEYAELTGKPLGITGEVAEYEAARLLGLELAEARQPGYDAIRRDGSKEIKVRIKGRRKQKGQTAGRVGRINTDHEWDTTILVLLDAAFDATEIYEADRAAIIEAIEAPGSRARNERKSLAISKFISIGRLIWSREVQ